jgi:hypothetical protein
LKHIAYASSPPLPPTKKDADDLPQQSSFHRSGQEKWYLQLFAYIYQQGLKLLRRQSSHELHTPPLRKNIPSNNKSAAREARRVAKASQGLLNGNDREPSRKVSGVMRRFNAILGVSYHHGAHFAVHKLPGQEVACVLVLEDMMECLQRVFEKSSV